jgi:hypothetical protein
MEHKIFVNVKVLIVPVASKLENIYLVKEMVFILKYQVEREKVYIIIVLYIQINWLMKMNFQAIKMHKDLIAMYLKKECHNYFYMDLQIHYMRLISKLI